MLPGFGARNVLVKNKNSPLKRKEKKKEACFPLEQRLAYILCFR